MVAACHRLRRRAETPKYMRDDIRALGNGARRLDALGALLLQRLDGSEVDVEDGEGKAVLEQVFADASAHRAEPDQTNALVRHHRLLV